MTHISPFLNCKGETPACFRKNLAKKDELGKCSSSAIWETLLPVERNFPALLSLGEYFHTTASRVQLGLTFSMVGLAVGQLFIGPLSDKYGRKKTLLESLVLFCMATMGCLYAPDIHWFIFFRLLQGMTGAGGVVISKSIATDLYEGRELARFYALLSSVQGLAPICAPVLGGLLLETTDWKGIFWILLVIGVSLVIALCFFKESLPWNIG